MKKGIIVNLRPLKLLNYVKLNKTFMALGLLFIVGVIVGSVWLTQNNWLTDITKSFLESFISLHKNASFFSKLYSSSIKYVVILILYFVTGTSMFGVAVTPFILTWQGIITGNIVSLLYSQYSLHGIAFNAIILIPPCSIFTVCCFFAAKYAIEFSLNIAKTTMPNSRPITLHNYFKEYCIKYLIILSITIVCALIEIILNILFLNFFNF